MMNTHPTAAADLTVGTTYRLLPDRGTFTTVTHLEVHNNGMIVTDRDVLWPTETVYVKATP